ncbi:hematopoietic death receptor isoform X2 [Syngnathoides biaculeatus]|uniref:hematopoietic death receptor isoform X2 n=1 Tax=Syngnathoides biaculeatus TaxID=300417 RepID=UPI002ADE7310|nr:hematopoietic death receptor isoform X2 [Syngnathoides biaculeatus]
MYKIPLFIVICGLSCFFTSPATVPRPGLDLGGIRNRREVHCRDGQYLNNNICCLNCPAGTHLKSPCTTPGERGQCEECADEMHMEHSNHLPQCFTCTNCRSDQEVVRSCSRTQDTECHCKEGKFCVPDQACEMCKKCLRCGTDEEVVRNCTATSNRECKKIPSQSSSGSDAVYIVPVVLIIVIVLVGGICWYKKKHARGSEANELKAEHAQGRKNEEAQRPGCSSLIFSQPRVRVQSSANVEDERQALCESCNSSANNSQQNLTSLPPAIPASAHRACLIANEPNLRAKEEPFLELLPVNGEESLRKSFQYFEEVDIDYYKRFFRELGLNGNVIKRTDQLSYDDKIHELLNIWFEKVGKDASLNDLLKALLEIDQRRTAEIIKEKALANGLFVLKAQS